MSGQEQDMNTAMEKKNDGGATKAMTVGTPTAEFRMAMEPANLGGLYDVAASFARISLCGVATTEEALARMLAGRELGLTMLQSMRGIYIIEGRPSLDASLMQALCMSRGDICEDFTQVLSDGQRATYRVKRVGKEPKEYTFTLDEARQALLLDRGATEEKKKQSNWNKYPKRMLEARAKSLAARSEFPDLMFGMYSREELDDEAEPRDPGAAQVAADAAVVLSAKPRDWAGEMEALKRGVDAAKGREEWAAARKSIDAWDAPDHWSKQLRAHYDGVVAARKAAADAKKAGSAAATTTAQAVPVPPSAPASAPAAQQPPFPDEPPAKRTREPGEEG